MYNAIHLATDNLTSCIVLAKLMKYVLWLFLYGIFSCFSSVLGAIACDKCSNVLVYMALCLATCHVHFGVDSLKILGHLVNCYGIHHN